MDIIIDKWEEIINQLKVEYSLSNISFNTWIVPLKILKVENQTVYITTPLKQSVELIRNKFYLPLKVCIEETTDIPYDIVFLAEGEETEEIKTSEEKTDHTPKSSKNPAHDTLIAKYTFDTFVVGSNNNFAHAAAVAVAESPGQVYNPLFIYGGVGLGKTHLMHSIAHYVIDQDPTKKILYVTSETFTNELIDTIRIGKTGDELAMNTFRNKYRNIDVLLIDDVQFIIGKERTQEEFFHTFNHLHNAGKQIIISSDRPPKDMETLEARLRTRFEWGLIADISSPDYETRMAILQKKIQLDHMEKYNIPQEVLEYIASNIKTNIRELEGSLNKLIFLYKLYNFQKPINITLAAEAIKDFISADSGKKVTPEYIIDIVSEHFNIPVTDLDSNKRPQEIAYARQIAMYLCRTLTDAPLKEIGALLGGKDHSTVNHGVNKISSEIENDDVLRNTIGILKKKINPL